MTSDNTRPDSWTREQALAEHAKMVSALQYTIGERDRIKALCKLMAHFMSTQNACAAQKMMQLMFTSTSERYQDIFALLACGGKEKGYFVEFGACDGVVANNTLTLEQQFGWQGILAEPAKCWHEDLKRNRSARIDERCVSSVTGNMLELYQAKTWGTSSVNKSHKYLGEVSTSYQVPTVSLMDLLKDHGAPSYIDFLSVDCEGHERSALQGFDFRKYRFGFICVEQHASSSDENDVSVLLEGAGYKVLFPRHEDKSKPPHMQISGIDLYYVDANNPILEVAGIR